MPFSPTSLPLLQIDVHELETMLAKDRATFPENPSVWLKDLASMLNVRLENVSEPDPVFEGKPRGTAMTCYMYYISYVE